MKPFLGADFLLSTDTAVWLYHDVAAKLPVLDYHCHIPPREIAENRRFDSMTQVWLEADHYKWRLMRAAGVPEELITGAGADREKFRAFAAIMPQLIGNSIYHWSHLELQRVFGVEETLNEQSADWIYDRCAQVLKDCSARDLIRRFRVKVICTTDDPLDELRWHEMIAADKTCSASVLPTFRPDRAINIEKPGFAAYIQKLGALVGQPLQSAEDVAEALRDRISYFVQHGCVVADHGMDYCPFAPPDPAAANRAFRTAMAGRCPDREDADAYKTLLSMACAKTYAQHDMAMQIHFGCLRNNNRLLFAGIGADVGGDCINSCSGAENVAPLLNAFAENGGLPKVVLYSLNANDNAALVTAMGCFQGGGAGRLQHGTAWWFHDNLPGMRRQMTELAANGVLGQFIGMLTDSRSFLSYTRHEYFRRILCGMIGEWVESGQYPNEEKQLKKLVEDICFHNANAYFGFRACAQEGESS